MTVLDEIKQSAAAGRIDFHPDTVWALAAVGLVEPEVVAALAIAGGCTDRGHEIDVATVGPDGAALRVTVTRWRDGFVVVGAGAG